MAAHHLEIAADALLDGYKLVRKLSEEGAQSQVWLACSESWPRTVAAKLCWWPSSDKHHVATRKEWDLEAQLWASISAHPNIARLVDYRQEIKYHCPNGETYSIKMFLVELAEGSVAKRLRENWPPARYQLLQWMLGMARGV